MSQHLVGLAEVAQFLGIVSRGKRPGNRLWELMRAGRLKQFPHVRIGRTYRFNMPDVEAYRDGYRRGRSPRWWPGWANEFR